MYKILDNKTGKTYPSKIQYFLQNNPSYLLSAQAIQHYFNTHQDHLTIIGGKGYKNGKTLLKPQKAYTHAAIVAGTLAFEIDAIKQTKNNSNLGVISQTIFESHKNFQHISREECMKIWQLDELDLKKECSEFYVLSDMAIDHSNDGYLMMLLSEKKRMLAEQFSRYLDLAIGGEIRHCIKQSFLASIGQGYYPIDRHQAWKQWKTIRDSKGLPALEAAAEGFGYEKTAYGGKNWNNITQVLLRYLKQEDTMGIFVDTVWGLEHNGGCCLNKIWAVPWQIKAILDAKFNGDVKALVPSCSDEIRKIWGGYNHYNVQH